MRRTKIRTAGVLLGTLTLMVTMTGVANAASFSYGAYEGGGYGLWQQDPGEDPRPFHSGTAPGDAIAACDIEADGWGIEVRLDIGRNGTIDRKISTRGHAAEWCSGWASGDIPEGTPVRVWVVKVNGTTDYHPVYKDGTA
ncbi:hypothetical protein ABZS29_30980 [Kribbella sp. NPDC005582]|uniref:hypothetical protein n=1 Tax=Kribbella sp. NPDC005582 TaxID=3156893 RepID=UPI0033B6643B